MAQLVIFGTGDIARLAHFYFQSDSAHQVVAFAVDRAFRNAESFLGLPLFDFQDLPARYPPNQFQAFIAVSYAKMNHVRAEKYLQAKEWGYQMASYVSSRCSLLTTNPLGDNCFILEDNTIQPFVTIGNNVTLWSGNHIGHDSIIEDHTFVSSHVVISGHVRVGSYCFLGVNATIHNSITLAPETLVGAGAVIAQDTIERGIYVPARGELLKKRSDQVNM